MVGNKLIVLILLVSCLEAVISTPLPDDESVEDKKEESSNTIPKVTSINRVDSKASAAQEAILIAEVPSNTPTETATQKPNGGEVFTRFINDIFQIPISVLKAVNNLVTNPFTTRVIEKKKDQ